MAAWLKKMLCSFNAVKIQAKASYSQPLKPEKNMPIFVTL